MKKSLIIKVSHEGVDLYGGHLDDRGLFMVFKQDSKNTVDDFCAMDFTADEIRDTKLGIIFSQSFSDDEQGVVRGKLQECGYLDQHVYSLDEWLCRTIKGHRFALSLSVDNDDLYACLYDTQNGGLLAAETIPSGGKDPRVEKLAEKIWSQFPGYLNKEKGFGEVVKAARAFLRTNKSELEGKVYLEGDNRDFFVTRRAANIDNAIDHGSTTIMSCLNNFANKSDLKKDETVVVLADGLAGNPYFFDIFNGFVPEMMELNDEVLRTLLTGIMNDLNELKDNIATTVTDELPLKNIHVRPGETSIAFNIDFPEVARTIEVYRDDELIRRLTTADFEDRDLQPDHEYMYRFVLVIKDEAGNEIKTKGRTKAVSTTSIQLPLPVELQVDESDNKATLTWADPERGELKVFWSDKPFNLHFNDRVDINNFDYKYLSSLDNRHVVSKDFCGERFYLPVTIVGNIGVTGDDKVVRSIVAPGGVRIDSTDLRHVKVIWVWNDMQMVRVKWVTENGNEDWSDVVNEGQAPELVLSLPPKARNIDVFVSSVYKTRDGMTLQSDERKVKIELKPVNVTFVNAKSEAGFFKNRDLYSVTLKAESEPPCDLYVLVGEGMVPMNLTNFKSYLTIPHQELADGREKKIEFRYNRIDKKESMYVRVIPAERDLPVIVSGNGIKKI